MKTFQAIMRVMLVYILHFQLIAGDDGKTLSCPGKYASACDNNEGCFDWKHSRCNGRKDCSDGSDEMNCGIFSWKWKIAVTVTILTCTVIAFIFILFKKKCAKCMFGGSGGVSSTGRQSNGGDRRYNWYLQNNSRENTSIVNHPPDSEVASDMDSSFPPRPSDHSGDSSHHSSNPRPRSWYENASPTPPAGPGLPGRPSLATSSQQPFVRSWYDMPTDRGSLQSGINSLTTSSPRTRSWYDVSDESRQPMLTTTSTLPSRALRLQPGSDRGARSPSPLGSPSHGNSQAPPAYHVAVTGSPAAEPPPPSYDSVIKRESFL